MRSIIGPSPADLSATRCAATTARRCRRNCGSGCCASANGWYLSNSDLRRWRKRDRRTYQHSRASDALARLQGIGEIGASRIAIELFWRDFNNRREVDACVGLVPQPYDSGESQVDQGISKQGNRRVRALLVEMAWAWLRYQPGSALTQWFNQRTQGTGPNRRARRIAIVAVARRLAIALWRYLKDGVIPEGAQLKPV